MTPEERLQRGLLEHKQRALTKSGEVAERKLKLAEKNLARCGPLRRRSRAELRATIELEQRSIALTRKQLTDTNAEIEALKLKLRTRNDEPNTRSHDRPLSRSRVLVQERER